MLVYHFVDPDLGIEILFGKEGKQNKGSVDFEIGYWGACFALVLEVKENLMEDLSAFVLFFW